MKRKLLLTALTGMILLSNISVKSIPAEPLTQSQPTASISYTFDTYETKKDDKQAKIEVLKINGLKDKELEKKLNDEFMQMSQSAYDEFMLPDSGIQFSEVDYTITSDTSAIVSIKTVLSSVMASSNQTFRCYTIDKKNQKLFTLSELFKDSSYIKMISDSIKEQMKTKMKNDEAVSYFIDSETEGLNFIEIKKDQNFYINENAQLVICFDKYEVAPGYMGAQEFIIPTDVIQTILNDTTFLH